MLFCCIKQKTAYEMRISDWSSDVCSSDLKFPEEGSCANAHRYAVPLDQLDRLRGVPSLHQHRGTAGDETHFERVKIAGYMRNRRGHQHHIARTKAPIVPSGKELGH